MSNFLATGLAPAQCKIKDDHSGAKTKTLIESIKNGAALTPKQQKLFKKLAKQLGMVNYNVGTDGIIRQTGINE